MASVIPVMPELLADALGGGQLMVFGVILVGAAFLLRSRTTARARRRASDPLREVQEEFRQAETVPSARLNQMEVRLYEFAREVEGRIQSRMTYLDQLVQDADREIKRLEALLAASSKQPAKKPVETARRHGPDIMIPQPAASNAPPNVPACELPASDEAAVKASDPRASLYKLYDSGLSPDEIAEAVGQPLSHVVLLLKMRPPSGLADAA